jgi:hypothetical protein
MPALLGGAIDSAPGGTVGVLIGAGGRGGLKSESLPKN